MSSSSHVPMNVKYRKSVCNQSVLRWGRERLLVASEICKEILLRDNFRLI